MGIEFLSVYAVCLESLIRSTPRGDKPVSPYHYWISHLTISNMLELFFFCCAMLCSLAASRCSRCAPHAPSVLSLKRLCSLSHPETANHHPKFGVCIIYNIKATTTIFFPSFFFDKVNTEARFVEPSLSCTHSISSYLTLPYLTLPILSHLLFSSLFYSFLSFPLLSSPFSLPPYLPLPYLTLPYLPYIYLTTSLHRV